MPAFDPNTTAAEATTDPAQWVTRTLAGDTAAFGHVVRAHQKSMWQAALSLVLDRAAAEGIVQQAFLQAYSQLEQFDTKADLGPWLRTITRNLARDELRRRAREDERLRQYSDYLQAQSPDDSDQEKRRQRLERAVTHCRAEMAPLAARALSLRYDEQRSPDEIAALIGRTEAATRQLLFRIREALRKCVQQQLESDGGLP